MTFEQYAVGPEDRRACIYRSGDAFGRIGEDPIERPGRIGIGHRGQNLMRPPAQHEADIRAAIGIAAGLGILAQAVDHWRRQRLIEDGNHVLLRHVVSIPINEKGASPAARPLLKLLPCNAMP